LDEEQPWQKPADRWTVALLLAATVELAPVSHYSFQGVCFIETVPTLGSGNPVKQ
jgi:hypothetical protein